MAIQNVGSIQDILKNHNAKDWTKSVEMDTPANFGTSGISVDPYKGHADRQSFSEMLASSIGEVNGLQKEANLAIEKLATGKSDNLHETMLAVEKAEIAFKTMNQIRTKVIDAYREVMRMQV